MPVLAMCEVASLIAALKKGDLVAREALIGRVYPQVRELVHKRLNHDFRRKSRWLFAQFSTGDVVQEVFLRVAESLRSFEGTNEDSLIAYLAVAVHRRLLDMLRFHGAARRDARQRVPQQGQTGTRVLDREPARAGTPSHHLIIREHLEIYQQALDAFEDKPRQLLQLRLEDGLSFADIADILGYASSDVACKAFHEAKARLLVRMRARGARFTEAR